MALKVEIPGAFPSPLKFPLAEIEQAFNSGFYWSAIVLSLTLPDVCATADWEGTPERRPYGPTYKKWCERWLSDAFDELTPDDLWALRCGVVHSSQSFGNQKPRYHRVVFALPGSVRVGSTGYGTPSSGELEIYSISADVFCQAIVDAVCRWIEQTQYDTGVRKRLDGLVRFRPGGYGEIRGIPAIA